MNKISGILMALILSQPTYAGLNGVTHHSRANCVNNESISWDATEAHWFKVYSLHHNNNSSVMTEHDLSTGWLNTWRAAAVHWGEGHGGWAVTGLHWMKDNGGREYVAQQERVTDCSVYDGWWDKK